MFVILNIMFNIVNVSEKKIVPLNGYTVIFITALKRYILKIRLNTLVWITVYTYISHSLILPNLPITCYNIKDLMTVIHYKHFLFFTIILQMLNRV